LPNDVWEDFLEDDFPDDYLGLALLACELSPTDPLDVIFWIIFPREKLAKQFIDEIRHAFDHVEYHRRKTGRTVAWDVAATKLMAPSHRAMTETFALLQEKADTFGGELDGVQFGDVEAGS
jgi:hypothetical protein